MREKPKEKEEMKRKKYYKTVHVYVLCKKIVLKYHFSFTKVFFFFLWYLLKYSFFF
jgi:hypothetical protein